MTLLEKTAEILTSHGVKPLDIYLVNTNNTFRGANGKNILCRLRHRSGRFLEIMKPMQSEALDRHQGMIIEPQPMQEVDATQFYIETYQLFHGHDRKEYMVLHERVHQHDVHNKTWKAGPVSFEGVAKYVADHMLGLKTEYKHMSACENFYEGFYSGAAGIIRSICNSSDSPPERLITDMDFRKEIEEAVISGMLANEVIHELLTGPTQ